MATTYDILYQPPALDAPGSLTFTSHEARLDIDVVHPTQATLRFTVVELTRVQGDWTGAMVVLIPVQETHAAVTLPGGVSYWGRAYGIDVWGNESAYTGIVATSTKTTARQNFPPGGWGSGGKGKGKSGSGPPGPQGPAGVTGATGAAGADGIGAVAVPSARVYAYLNWR